MTRMRVDHGIARILDRRRDRTLDLDGVLRAGLLPGPGLFEQLEIAECVAVQDRRFRAIDLHHHVVDTAAGERRPTRERRRACRKRAGAFGGRIAMLYSGLIQAG